MMFSIFLLRGWSFSSYSMVYNKVKYIFLNLKRVSLPLFSCIYIEDCGKFVVAWPGKSMCQLEISVTSFNHSIP
eukprot:GAHX01002234.1.p1 GENE.GAHX01002234.1~~GAHX01002234.1.p1  ORF type:complete len:74 (+),score=1.55 GAHX01002234.1:71-292(+)